MESVEPELEGINIVKTLYKTKLSTIWLAKYNDSYVILKGKKRKEISTSDFEFLKRERAFLESNTGDGLISDKFPHFIKSAKDDNFLYMIVNFIEGADLSSLIKENILKFDQGDLSNNNKHHIYLHFISQLVNLFQILHHDRYIYRDLKMNNIIINKNLDLFLIDFGFVKKLDEESSRTNTICGTYHAMAPEMFSIKFGKTTDYSNKVDIYSLGVLFYELFSSKPPFPYVYDYSNENLKSYYEIISAGINDTSFESFPNNTFAENLKDLIKGCMNVDPVKRLTLQEIITHSIFENKFTLYLDNKNFIQSDYAQNIIESITFNGDFIDTYEYLSKEEDVFEKFF